MSCWFAPCRMQKASASTSRTVVVGKVSEPVSSWMPSANRVASSGVTAMPRSLMMRSISVTSEPSSESDEARPGETKPGRPPSGRWWSKTTTSTPSRSQQRRRVRRDDWRARSRPGSGASTASRSTRARVDGADLVGEQRAELAHVAVHGAAEADLGLGIELVRGDHAGEGVEVGVGVRGDDLADPHAAQYTRASTAAGALTAPGLRRLQQPGELVAERRPHRVAQRARSRAVRGAGRRRGCAVPASRARTTASRSRVRRASLRSGSPDWRAPKSCPSPRISRSRSASAKPSVVSSSALMRASERTPAAGARRAGSTNGASPSRRARAAGGAAPVRSGRRPRRSSPWRWARRCRPRRRWSPPAPATLPP